MMKNTTKSWCVVATEDLKSKRLRNGFKYSRLCLVWKAFPVPWIGIASGGTFSHSYNVRERDCIRFTERIDRMVFVQGVRAVSEKVNCSSLLLLLLPPPPPTTTTTDEAATKTHNTRPQQNQRIDGGFRTHACHTSTICGFWYYALDSLLAIPPPICVAIAWYLDASQPNNVLRHTQDLLISCLVLRYEERVNFRRPSGSYRLIRTHRQTHTRGTCSVLARKQRHQRPTVHSRSRNVSRARIIVVFGELQCVSVDWTLWPWMVVHFVCATQVVCIWCLSTSQCYSIHRVPCETKIVHRGLLCVSVA